MDKTCRTGVRGDQPMLYAVLAGYAHVFDTKRREETVEVREHAGDPDADRDLRVEIDPDDATQTRAFVRDRSDDPDHQREDVEDPSEPSLDVTPGRGEPDENSGPDAGRS